MIGYINNEQILVDDVVFSTTSDEYLNKGSYCATNISSLQFDKIENTPKTITITSSSDWNLNTIPDWLTVNRGESVNNNGIFIEDIIISVLDNDTTTDRAFDIIISLVSDSNISCTISVNQYSTVIKEISYVSVDSITDYIDTQYIPNITTSVEAKFYIDNKNSGASQIFGSRTSSSSSDKFVFYYGGTTSTVPNTFNFMLGDASIGNTSFTAPSDGMYELITDSTGCTLNGVRTNLTSVPTFSTSNLPMYIFGLNQAGSLISHPITSTKLYYLRIYENNKLVHNFVPAVDSDGIVSIYDKVTASYIYSKNNTLIGDVPSLELSEYNATILGSSGTRNITIYKQNIESDIMVSLADNTLDWLTVTLAEDKSSFTISYTENTSDVERSATIDISCGTLNCKYVLTQKIKSDQTYTRINYLQSDETGSPYILTDIIPDSQNTKIEIKGSMTTSSCALIGSRTSSANKRYDFMRSNDQKAMFTIANSGVSSIATTTSAIDNAAHIYILSKDGITKDGTQVTMAVSPSTFIGDYPFMLFADNTAGAVTNNKGIRTIYYCKIWNNNTLILDMIPVLDNNNIPCMYDLIGNQFYYSKNSAEFTYE